MWIFGWPEEQKRISGQVQPTKKQVAKNIETTESKLVASNICWYVFQAPTPHKLHHFCEYSVRTKKNDEMVEDPGFRDLTLWDEADLSRDPVRWWARKNRHNTCKTRPSVCPDSRARSSMECAGWPMRPGWPPVICKVVVDQVDH